MSARIHFTTDMDAALREMRAVGAGAKRVADRIGVAPSVALRRIDELGLPKWGRGGAATSSAHRRKRAAVAAKIDGMGA